MQNLGFRDGNRKGYWCIAVVVLILIALLLWSNDSRKSSQVHSHEDNGEWSRRYDGHLLDTSHGAQGVKEGLDMRVGGSSLSSIESLGFYDEPDEFWRMRKERLSRQRRVQDIKQTSDKVKGNVWFQEHWEPEWGCILEERIGRMGSGGKWVCDLPKIPRGDCLMYSIGSFGDWSFEKGIHERRSCEVHAFGERSEQVAEREDGEEEEEANESGAVMPKFIHFHPWGLGPFKEAKPTEHYVAKAEDVESADLQTSAGSVEGVDSSSGIMERGIRADSLKPSFNADVLSLPEIIQRLGHSKRRIDILKINIDGTEFEALLPLLTTAAVSPGDDDKDRQLPSEPHFGAAYNTQSQDNTAGWSVAQRRDDDNNSSSQVLWKTALPLIRQVLLEIHIKGRHTAEHAKALLNAFADNGYVVFHKEPNIGTGGGKWVEYGLVQLNVNEL